VEPTKTTKQEIKTTSSSPIEGGVTIEDVDDNNEEEEEERPKKKQKRDEIPATPPQIPIEHDQSSSSSASMESDEVSVENINNNKKPTEEVSNIHMFSSHAFIILQPITSPLLRKGDKTKNGDNDNNTNKTKRPSKFFCEYLDLSGRSERFRSLEHLNSTIKHNIGEDIYLEKRKTNPEIFVAEPYKKKPSRRRPPPNIIDDDDEDPYSFVQPPTKKRIRSTTNNGKSDKYCMSKREFEFYAKSGSTIDKKFESDVTQPENNQQLLLRDPIFATRRFPSSCWGFNFFKMFQFLRKGEPNSAWKRYTRTFNENRFVKLVTELYPGFEKIERDLYMSIKEWRKSQYSSTKKKKTTKKNDDDEEEEEDEEVESPSNDEEKSVNDTQEKDTDDTNISIQWLDILLPKSNDQKIFTSLKAYHSSSINDHDRVLPVVLFPFFIYSLQSRTNPPISLSLYLLDTLKNHRNYLFTQYSSSEAHFVGVSANSQQLNCLEATIEQFDKNIQHLLYHAQYLLFDFEFHSSMRFQKMENRIQLHKEEVDQCREEAEQYRDESNKKIKKLEKYNEERDEKIKQLEDQVKQLMEKKSSSNDDGDSSTKSDTKTKKKRPKKSK
jgi:hypothetical protein